MRVRLDAGVVEPGGDRLGVQHLSVLVCEQRRACAVQNAGPAGAEAGGVRRLPQTNSTSSSKPAKSPDRVRAAADLRDRCIGQAALELEDLFPSLAADDGLELADELGIRGCGPTREPSR